MIMSRTAKIKTATMSSITKVDDDDAEDRRIADSRVIQLLSQSAIKVIGFLLRHLAQGK